VDGGIDVAQADSDWARKTRPSHLQIPLHAEQPRRAPLSYLASKNGDRLQEAVQAATLLDGHFAELARIEIEERNRRLVNRGEFEAALMVMARRAAQVLAAESDPARIEAILVAEIRAAARVEGSVAERPHPTFRVGSSIGRASVLQTEGSGFDSRSIHQPVAGVAQMAEQRSCKSFVGGSNPSTGSSTQAQ
jgi:hypothetical protein